MKKILSALLFTAASFSSVLPAAHEDQSAAPPTIENLSALMAFMHKATEEYAKKCRELTPYFISNDAMAKFSGRGVLIDAFLDNHGLFGDTCDVIEEIIGRKVESANDLTLLETMFLRSWQRTYQYAEKVENAYRRSGSRPEFEILSEQFITTIRLLSYLGLIEKVPLHIFLKFDEFKIPTHFKTPLNYANTTLTGLFLGSTRHVVEWFPPETEKNLTPQVLQSIHFLSHHCGGRDAAFTALNNLIELEPFIQLEHEELRTDLETLRNVLGYTGARLSMYHWPSLLDNKVNGYPTYDEEVEHRFDVYQARKKENPKYMGNLI